MNPLDFVKARWAERTTWDGTVLIGVGLVALFFSPLVTWVAWGAIIYGAWTLFKGEDEE